MNEVAWLPPLLVLAAGLAIGLAASAAVRRSRQRKADAAELVLERRDLEARRDDLYRRLRSPDLAAGDRESLELAAAHTLRKLDRLAPQRSSEPPAAAPTPEAPPAGPAPAAAGAPRHLGGRHPALVGFVAGMAVVLLVGWLVYLAVRDSGAGQPAPPPSGSAEAPHPGSEELPAETRRELERLEAAVAAAPGDLLAFKRLALARLDAGLYFEAFSDAQAILASQPEDPDGLFIQGVVQLTMGRAAEALDLLDRVLVRFPEHLQAMIYRGLALAQGGDMEQAIASWEVALEMAGGSHPDIEMLLQQASAQGQALAAAAAPPPPAATAPQAAPPAAPMAAPAPSTTGQPLPAEPPGAAGPAYRVSVALAPGRSAPPGSVLFVFLRPGEAGPPAAVKRIPAPRFPLELTLGAGDAMMAGGELPAEGILVARLSATGNVTRSPDDLEASTSAALGQPVQLVLGGPG